MPGYYDEITGEWVEDDSGGGSKLDDTSGTGTIDYNAVVNPDGSVTYTDPDGSVYTVNQSGTYSTQWGGKTWTYDPSKDGFVDSSGKVISTGSAPSGLIDKIVSAIQKNPLAAAGAAFAATRGNTPQTGGYQGSIPNLQAVRQQVQYNDPNRRPGEGGRQYFTDVQYAKQGDQAAIDAAKAASQAQASGLQAAYTAAAPQVNPYAGKFAMPWKKPEAVAATQTQDASSVSNVLPVGTANKETGALEMAKGGVADIPRYLRGQTDGMADKIDTSIDGKEPAKLSHGEFVIPADVVSHLGNGNSDAGAEKLYDMMARIRKARTGNPEQGKRINPDKFMPGGAVKQYDGVTNGSVVTGAGATSSGVTGTSNPSGATTSSTLSPWAGDYVTNYLGKGQALANQPYQTYTGPLTAGASDLQQQQFAGLSDLAKTGLTPTQYTGGVFDAAAAKQYMNPYLSAALNPQLEEMRRQSQINLQPNLAKLTQAGGYGGGRQAIIESEAARNLLAEQNKTIGSGYASAYDKAMQQYNADTNRRLDVERAQQAANEASANFGLKTLQDLGQAGATQRGITSEGIAADKAQFEEQRDYPYKMVQYQKDLLTGLPITTQATTPNTTEIGRINEQLNGILALYRSLAAALPQAQTEG